MRRTGNVRLRPRDILFRPSGQLTAHPGLTLTARAEAQIATHVTQRPTTAASNASSGLSSVVPSLLSAIEEGEDGGQEAFQATVCLGWLHYILEEPALAVGRLPNDFGAAATHLSASAMALSGWTRVCLVKGTYVKGMALILV